MSKPENTMIACECAGLEVGVEVVFRGFGEG